MALEPETASPVAILGLGAIVGSWVVPLEGYTNTSPT